MSRHPDHRSEEQEPVLKHPAEPAPPAATGDPDADAVLTRLWSVDRSDPADELTAFRDALDELTGLTQDQPRLPGRP